MTLSATAILVTYNSAAVIGAALASLPRGMAAMVVDNASTDESAAIAEQAGAKVIRNATNLGFGTANNRGIETADTEWVLLLNPDAQLHGGFLEAMAEAASQHPGAALLVPTITTSKGAFEKHRSLLTPQTFKTSQVSSGIRSIGFASGGVVLARRDVLCRLGGFDPDIFLYFEDDDLSRRVLDAGHLILLVEAAKADHTGNVSTPATPALTYMKHWHMAWSERHVRQKFRLGLSGYWRILESLVKMLFAAIRGQEMERAKQRGLMDGTLAHMKGKTAMSLRDSLTTLWK